MTAYIFHVAWWFMKMEKKQCTKCKHFLLFECFRINKRTAQLTRRCSKCLDNEKMYKENRKCEHGRLKEICCECKGSWICEHNKRRSTCCACGGKLICHNQSVKNVVVVPSANIKRSGQSVEAVTDDLFVSMKKWDVFVGPAMEVMSGNISNKKIDVQIVIPLDILSALYAIVLILP